MNEDQLTNKLILTLTDILSDYLRQFIKTKINSNESTTGNYNNEYLTTIYDNHTTNSLMITSNVTHLQLTQNIDALSESNNSTTHYYYNENDYIDLYYGIISMIMGVSLLSFIITLTNIKNLDKLSLCKKKIKWVVINSIITIINCFSGIIFLIVFILLFFPNYLEIKNGRTNHYKLINSIPTFGILGIFLLLFGTQIFLNIFRTPKIFCKKFCSNTIVFPKSVIKILKNNS